MQKDGRVFDRDTGIRINIVDTATAWSSTEGLVDRFAVAETKRQGTESLSYVGNEGRLRTEKFFSVDVAAATVSSAIRADSKRSLALSCCVSTHAVDAMSIPEVDNDLILDEGGPDADSGGTPTKCTSPPPETTLFPTAGHYGEIVRSFYASGLEKTLEEKVPSNCGLIRAWLPQMQRLQGHRKVVLVLGKCRKYNDSLPSVEHPTCETEKIVACLEMAGYRVLHLDARQVCRRTKNDSACAPLQTHEANMAVAATAVNLKVAMDEYDIEFSSVFSYSQVWKAKFSGLLLVEPRLRGLPHHHCDIHLGWYGKPWSYTAKDALASEMSKAYRELSRCLSKQSSGVIDLPAEDVYDRF